MGFAWRICAGDLVQPEAPEQIYEFTRGKILEIELLINNAGFGAFGNNHEIAPQRLAEMIQVNCAAVVHLTSLFVPPMVERKRGDVMIVASTAAFQPVPFIAAYAATKAFDLIFAEGIAEELRPLGVHVCALVPRIDQHGVQAGGGPAGPAIPRGGNGGKSGPGRAGGASPGKTVVISGEMNRLMVAAERLAPRRFVAKMAAKTMMPRKAIALIRLTRRLEVRQETGVLP